MNFGDHPVLEGVNLQIEAGERLCLLGQKRIYRKMLPDLYF
jgi:ABC-type Fe3+/spermidine/putrescine transport system ATPase subunit